MRRRGDPRQPLLGEIRSPLTQPGQELACLDPRHQPLPQSCSCDYRPPRLDVCSYSVLRCRPTTAPAQCGGCGNPGGRHDAVLRRLAHVPFGWKPTVLEVVVPRYRCVPCRRIWRHDIRAAAPSKLSRDAVMMAVKSIVVDPDVDFQGRGQTSAGRGTRPPTRSLAPAPET